MAVIYALAFLTFSRILTFSCFLSRIPCCLFSSSSSLQWQILSFSICDIFTAFSFSFSFLLRKMSRSAAAAATQAAAQDTRSVF